MRMVRGQRVHEIHSEARAVHDHVQLGMRVSDEWAPRVSGPDRAAAQHG